MYVYKNPLITNSLPYHNSNSNADVPDCINKWKEKENEGEKGSSNSPKFLFIEKMDADQKQVKQDKCLDKVSYGSLVGFGSTKHS